MKPLMILSAIITIIALAGFWAVRFGPLGFVQGYFLSPPSDPAGSVTLFEPQDGLKYFVYLPHDYAADGGEYPVIYHLHGAMPFPWSIAKKMVRADIGALANQIEGLVSAGEAEPTIIVAPYDGFGFSMWSDSSSGHEMVETQIVAELMPKIEQGYAVSGSREATSIQGFSMGGFGALKIGLKYPDRFARVTSWDGAVHSWETLSSSRASIVENMFASEADFDRHSPWKMAETLAANPDGVRPKITLFSGRMEAPATYTAAFQEHLTSLGIEFRFSTADCPHDIFCFMTPERIADVYSGLGK